MAPSSPDELLNSPHYQSIRSVKQKKIGNIEGLVIKRGDIRSVSMKNGVTKKVLSVILQDASDNITITLWEQHILRELEIYDKLQIKGVYVKENSYSKQLEGSISKNGQIRRIAWPLSLDLPNPEKKVLLEFKRIMKHNLPLLSHVSPKSYGLKIFEQHVVEIGLYLKGIPELPESLGNLTHLQCLYASNNHLAHLPSSLCHLSHLQTLDVRWNRLTELPPQMETLQNLQTLHISENSIKIIPNSLEHCKKLTRIEFDHNPIEIIPDSLSIQALSKYTHHLPPLLSDQEKKAMIRLGLQLKDQLPEIGLITHNSFGYVTKDNKVVGIGLYRQQLRNFPLVLFDFGCLEVLNIAKNHLTDLPPIADHLPFLSKIFLRENRWSNLPSTLSSYLSRRYSQKISNIQEIEVILELETMLDEVIPLLPPNAEKTFGFVIGRGHITEIYLDCKNLETLPQSFGVCMHLQIFSAKSNNFQTLPTILSSCTNLTHIFMASNHISQIPKWILKLEHIKALDLQYNQLNHLPAELTQLNCLHSLNLQSNNILELPSSFGNLRTLRKLDLGNNNIKTLPASCSGLTQLSHLNLNQNQLTQMPESISHLQNLRELDLSWNAMKLSPQELEAIQPKLRCDNFTLKTRASGKIKFAQMDLPLKEVQGLMGLEFLLGKPLVHDNNLSFRKFGVSVSNGHVTQLSLPNLGLNDFPEIIGSFRNLEMLSLYSNNITAIPHIIGTFQNLSSLYLNSNQISEISDLIGHTSLTTINLNKNKLEFLPDGFMNLKNLEVCKLEHNPWQDIPHALWNLHQLTTLKLTRSDFPPLTQNVIRGGISTILDYAYRRAFFYDEMLQKLDRNHSINDFDKSHPELCKYAHMLEEKCQELNNVPAKQLLALFNEKCFIQKERFKIWL